MIRLRLAQLALRAYPREVARSRGPEMVSVMLEMSAGSRLAFARELVVLALYGLRERSRAIAGSGWRQLTTDACSTALILYLAVPTWGLLSRAGTLPTRHVVQSLGVLVTCVALALLLAGYNRWVGVGGLIAIAIGVTITALQGQPPLRDVLSPFVRMAVPAVCCAVLAIAPGKRPPNLLRLSWFALLVVLAIVVPPDPFAGLILFGLGYQSAFLAAASAVGVLRLPFDPRLALGCGLVWATIAMRMIYSNIVFGFAQTDTLILWCSALMLSAAAVRLALMRQRQPA